MKKLFVMMVAIYAMLPTIANALPEEIDGICYNFSDTEAEVTQNPYSYYSGDIIIPNTVTYNNHVYSVTKIGFRAFKGCEGVTAVTIGNCVTSIEGDAFYKCKGLVSVKISNSVTNIGDGAFSHCSSLTSVEFPGSITYIGWSAFDGCTSLTAVQIPNSVTHIGPRAFGDCTKLASIKIPSSVTDIGGNAFAGTAWYEKQPDGMVYINRVAYKYKGTMPENTHIRIEDGTVTIAGSAFADCTGMTSIEIPNSVTTIGSWTFYGCTSLASIEIPNSVTFIDNIAFGSCTGLTVVEISNSMTSIEANTFSYCSGLKSVKIPNSVTSINTGAFLHCSSLATVEIPNSVTDIGENTFAGCPIDNMYCYSEALPGKNVSIFGLGNLSNSTLHVPASSIEQYKINYPWNMFGHIVALTGEELAVGNPRQSMSTNNHYYSIDGRLTENLLKGIYIVNGKKVMVK